MSASTPVCSLRSSYLRSARRVALSALILSGTATGGCAAMHHSPKSDDLAAEARAVDAAFAEAFNRGDLEGMMRSYWISAETLLFPPDQSEARGSDAIRQGFARLLKEQPGARFQLVDPQYRVEGSTVIGTGQWKLIIPAPDGHVTTTSGRFSEVFARRDGKLVVIVDHASLPLMQSPAEPSPKSRQPKARGKQRKA